MRALVVLIWLAATGAIVSRNHQPQHASITDPFRKGVTAYTRILRQLTGILPIHFIPAHKKRANLRGWAERLGDKVAVMASSFNDSKKAALQLVDKKQKIFNELVIKADKLNKDVADSRKEVKACKLNVKGAEANIEPAEKRLKNAQNSFNSRSKELDSARAKLKKAKDKCISGRLRRRRATDEEEEPEFQVAEEEETPKEEGGDSDPMLKRVKRSFFISDIEKVVEQVAKKTKDAFEKDVKGAFVTVAEKTKEAFEKDVKDGFVEAGEKIQMGICRAIGEMTGQVKNLERDKDKALASRNEADANLSSKKQVLQDTKERLEKSKRTLQKEEERQSQLVKDRNKVQAEMTLVTKVADELKDATKFIDHLLKTGIILTEAIEEVFILRVSSLAKGLNGASELLKNEKVPGVPAPSKAQMAIIKKNLLDFNENLNNYPLIIKKRRHPR